MGTTGAMRPSILKLFLWGFGSWLLAGCQSPLPGDVSLNDPAARPSTVREVYIQALSELGPHRYTNILIPAVVEQKESPMIEAPVYLGDGAKKPLREPGPADSAEGVWWWPFKANADARSKVQHVKNIETAPSVRSPAKQPQGHVSEIRFGALKHAVAFGHAAKETGMDANVEMLFTSPDWLRMIWSPWPHMGFTINASETNTDFFYAGLTWEWAFLKDWFIDLGLGLSVHDGMLNNSQIAGKARFDRREFGCRALFRESLEIGYRLFGRHSLSVMWAHHSHASLCLDDDDGIDNAGLRYGYRL